MHSADIVAVNRESFKPNVLKSIIVTDFFEVKGARAAQGKSNSDSVLANNLQQER